MIEFERSRLVVRISSFQVLFIYSKQFKLFTKQFKQFNQQNVCFKFVLKITNFTGKE